MDFFPQKIQFINGKFSSPSIICHKQMPDCQGEVEGLESSPLVNWVVSGKKTKRSTSTVTLFAQLQIFWSTFANNWKNKKSIFNLVLDDFPENQFHHWFLQLLALSSYLGSEAKFKAQVLLWFTFWKYKNILWHFNSVNSASVF